MMMMMMMTVVKVVLKCRMTDQWFLTVQWLILEHVAREGLTVVGEGPVVPVLTRLQHVADRGVHCVRR